MENQFLALENWTYEILNAIKKDIKQDHLDKDPEIYKKYFGNRPKNRLTTEEIFSAYEKELTEGNESLSEWVVNRWVFKNGDLYNHFADRLSEINPDFSKIEELTLEQAQKVLDGAVESFGAIPTFLFSILNGVVLPEDVMNDLQVQAENERSENQKKSEKNQEEAGLEKVIDAQKREISRLETKILGVQKKYTKDTEALKKQIKALQKQLSCK